MPFSQLHSVLCLAAPAHRRQRVPAYCTYLDGLRYVHLVNFNLRKAASRHIFVLLLIAIKEVGGINANADGPLGGGRNKQSAPAEGAVQ